MPALAYYNEFDAKAAAWLRELMAEGLIAPGDVDERSIVDVTATDLVGYAQCHFFAGIGGWSYALRLAEWPDDEPVWTGSCPCQPFSVGGRQLKTLDSRHLWPQFRRLIRQCRPATVFGEQVASAAGRVWFDGVRANLEALAYVVGGADLCAAGVGAPHVRQRLYFVAHSLSSRLSGRKQRPSLSVAEKATCAERDHSMVGTWQGLASDCPALPLVDGLTVTQTRDLVEPLGNAIVPQVAEAFIRSYREVMGHA